MRKYWDIIRYHSFYPWHDKNNANDDENEFVHNNGGKYVYDCKKLRPFKQANIMIDILLDCDKGEVEFAIVDKPDLFRPKFWNIQCIKNENGWVPHINTVSSVSEGNLKARVVKIDVSFYGIYNDEIDEYGFIN